MVHHTRIDFGIGWSISAPDAGEPVIEAQFEMRKWFVVKKVTIPVVEIIVLVVAYFDHAVFCPESVAVIIPHLMMEYFDGPVVQVFPIEKADPLFLWRVNPCNHNQQSDATQKQYGFIVFHAKEVTAELS
jgi:hypothetical protein